MIAGARILVASILLSRAGLAFASVPNGGSDTISTLTWFPADRLFPRLLADGTAPQLSLNKDLQTRRIVGSIGGVQRLLQATIANFPVQLGVGATVYASFIKTPNVLDVVTVDFFVDFPLDIRLSDRFALRTGWGHYSAHLADDGIERLQRHSINYAKDYSPLLVAYTVPGIGGMVYGGARFDYFTIPEYGKHWILQAGAEAGNIRILDGVRLYGALDLKAKSEVHYATTQSYQVGIKLLERDVRAIRFAFTYRTGIEERGQMYAERSTVSMLGAYFDF